MSQRVYKAVFLTAAALVVLALAVRVLLPWHGARRENAAAGRFAAAVVPLEIDTFRGPKVEPRANAAHWVRAGSLAATLTQKQRGTLRDMSFRLLSDWNEEDFTAARRLVADNAAALDLLARAVELDASRSNFDLRWEDGIAAVIPDLVAVLNSARLLLAETRLALADGRDEDARRAARTIWSLAHACYNEPVMIFDLIAVALERTFWEAVYEITTRPGGQDFLAAAVVETGAVNLEQTLRLATASEAWVMHDADATTLGVVLLSKRLSWWQHQKLHCLKGYGVAATIDYYARMLELYATLPASEIIDLPDGSSRRPEFQGSEQVTVDFESVVVKLKALEAQRAMAASASALLAAARQAGRYPPDLPEGGANPLTGSPLSYELSAEGGVVLTVPGARELWEKQYREAPRLPVPRFRWQLPAPELGF